MNSDHNYSGLEKRLRGELMRKRALDCLPQEIGREMIEYNPLPILIYRDNSVYYANPATLEQVGYNFKEISTFNNATVNTGEKKKRIDDILKLCAIKGPQDIDLEIEINTLDGKKLSIESRMKYLKDGINDYWIAYVTYITKTDPSTAKGRAKRLIRDFMRIFDGEYACLPAPEFVDMPYVKNVVKNLAIDTQKLLLDFNKTKGIDKTALNSLCEAANSFKDIVFLVNNEELLRLFAHYQIPLNCIYRRRNLKLEFAPAWT